MKIITMLGQKGGCGKTTLAENLAVAAVEAGLVVAALDIDSQKTLTKWSQRRQSDQPAVVALAVEPLEPVLTRARKEKVDLVIIDTSPRTDERTVAAVRSADLVLMPMQPSIHDVETLPALVEVLTVAGSPTAMVVLNQLPSSGPYRAEVEQSANTYGLEVCPVTVGQRRPFLNAPKAGLATTELDPSGKGAQEIRDLFRFVYKLLNLQTCKPMK